MRARKYTYIIIGEVFGVKQTPLRHVGVSDLKQAAYYLGKNMQK